jgi:hypothetical protein
MALCVEHGIDILLTIDKNLQYQQNLDRYPLTIVVFNSFTSRVDELIQFIPSFEASLSSFEKHRAYILDR